MLGYISWLCLNPVRVVVSVGLEEIKVNIGEGFWLTRNGPVHKCGQLESKVNLSQNRLLIFLTDKYNSTTNAGSHNLCLKMTLPQENTLKIDILYDLVIQLID